MAMITVQRVSTRLTSQGNLAKRKFHLVTVEPDRLLALPGRLQPNREVKMFKRCLLEHRRCRILRRKTKSRLHKTGAPCWRRSVTRTPQVPWLNFSLAMLRAGPKYPCIWRTKTCWTIWIRIRPICRIIKVSRWAFWDPIISSIWTPL